MNPDDSNPYAPPTSPVADPDYNDATADRPWVVKKEIIVCYADELHLPKFCIGGGDSKDLVLRQASLVSPRGFTYVCSLLLMIVPTVALSTQNGTVAGVYLGFGAILTVVFLMFGRLFRATPLHVLFRYIDAKWYVSREHVNSSKMITWILRILGGTAVFVVVFLIQLNHTPLLQNLAVSSLIGGATFLVAFLLNAESMLRFHGVSLLGKHSGRVLVRGHSQIFYEQVDLWLRENAWQAGEASSNG